MIVSPADAKSYMHVDHDDDDIFIYNCIQAAEEYLLGAIGSNYNRNSERARMLALMVVSDLYDNRGITERVSTKIRTIVENFAQQIRLETRSDNNVST